MKKVLSLVLSLCLFVSLGAGLSFTADAAATDLYYDFTLGATANGAVPTGLTSYDAVNALDTKNVSDDWMFHSQAVSGYVQYVYKNKGIYINCNNRKNTTSATFQFNVPTAGKYFPFLDLNTTNWGNASAFNVEIYKVDAGALGEKLLSKDLYMASYGAEGAMAALADAALNLAAGDYAVKLSVINVQQGSICIDGLKLLAADSNVAATIKVGNEEGLYEVRVGEKIQIPLSGTLTDGSAINIATANGWVTPADTDAVHVRVNKENRTLDITGLAEKSTPELWTISLGQAKAFFNVIVRPADYEAPDKNLVYSFGAVRATTTSYNSIHLGYAKWPYALTTVNAVGKAYNSTETDPWCIYSKKTTAGVENQKMYFSILYSNDNVAFYDAGTVTMGIKVPVDGKYTPKVASGSLAADCTYTLKSADGATTYASATVPASAAGTTYALSATPVELKAGEYLIVMNKTTAKAMNYIERIHLTYEGGLTYNVALDAGAGTAASDVTSYTHGTAVTLPAVTAPAGYTFDGWVDAKGNVATAIAANARGDKAYTATYTKIPVTFAVTLNANGGTVAADLTSYTEGVGATLPAATKTGYAFGGWYDNADLIGTAVTAIAADATGAKEFWAKWTLDVDADDFTVSSDSGYIAYYISNPNRTGVIAVSAAFTKSSVFASIEKVGIMIYVAGNETNEAKIARVEIEGAGLAALAAANGQAKAKFTDIAKENFGKEVLAKAYVVIDGQYVYSDVHVADVSYDKWIGVPTK